MKFPACPGKGWPTYDAAERVARRRGTAGTLGFSVWRCYRCQLFHVSAFALETA